MKLPKRKPLRLKEYDYSQNGAYFVTVCTQDRKPLFGHIVGAGPRPARTELSPLGLVIVETWNNLPRHNSGISLGPFIAMPDHIHGIVILDDRAGLGPAPTPLSEIMRQLKSFSARRINTLRGTPGAPLWQRGYYEHVIRNQDDFDAAAEYIQTNPARWLERQAGTP